MKHAALLLALLVGTPAWAGLQINSNDVRINVDGDDVDEWKDKHDENCSTVEIGNVKMSNEECDGKGKNKNKNKNKNKENSSVHGDNNPGKGHNKNKNK
ncbi:MULTISPECIES: CG2 omega domain protein [Aeromonas]|uniref:CG2 omega domain protein n=1 Tax=Aeromonas TaxID=642 RepID=UPI001269BAA0|nr:MULTISPECIES: CG2 omega domain protein [Aeromonas]MCH7370902.1 hypothetical protein [Aeromonas sp. MR16]